MSKAKKQKRFRYTLESLLKVRVIREKQQKDVLAKAEQAYQAELQKEKELQDQLAATYTALDELFKEGLMDQLNKIELLKHHVTVLKEKITEQEKVRREAEKKRDEEQEKLIKLAKERKIIEKDKDKTRDKWKRIMDKEDAKFMDEIASVRFFRQQQK